MLGRLVDRIRIGGSMGRAMALLAGFVVMFLFLPRNDQQLVATEAAVGTVTISPDRPVVPVAQQWLAQVRLDDGRHVKVLFPPPAPRDGDTAPLRVERYDNGQRRFFLDGEQWQQQHPFAERPRNP